MLTINIEHGPTGGYSIKLRSDESDGFTSAIEALKNYIDPSYRSYDPQTKKWHVDEMAASDVHDWLDYCRSALDASVEWFGARRNEQKRAEQPPPKKIQLVPHVESYRVFYLVPGCPPELVKAAYRCLAQLHHPDHGGDTAQPQRIRTYPGTFLMMKKN